MPKKLIIVGAGGCGREVAWIAADACATGNVDWIPAGFLDDNPHALDGTGTDLPVLGSVTDWQPSSDEVFVCAIGNPQVRDRIARSLEERGAVFASVIHPSAAIAPSAVLGEGLVIYPFVCLSVDTSLAAHVQVNMHSVVGHDAQIGRSAVLSSFCDVTGHTRIGERAFLGSNVSIAPGLKVGDDAMVGMGSIVVAPVRAGKRVFGNPAKLLKL